MAYCANCGNPLAEDAKFCGNCGQPVGEAVAADEAAVVAEAAPAAEDASKAPEPAATAADTAAAVPGAPAAAAPAAAIPTPPPPPSQPFTPETPPPPPSYSQGPGAGMSYGQAPYGQPPRGRSLKWLWIALAALAVIVAIVLVLVLVVFNGDDSGATEPEKTVSKLLDAMENQDIDGIFEVLDPEMLGSEFGDEFMDLAKEAMGEELFSEGSIEFSDIKMKTEETGDTAVVTIVEGKVTITEDGDSETEDVNDSEEPVEFYLVKRDGKWYVDPMSMNW